MKQYRRSERLNSAMHHISYVPECALYEFYLKKRIMQPISETAILVAFTQEKINLFACLAFELVSFESVNEIYRLSKLLVGSFEWVIPMSSQIIFHSELYVLYALHLTG